MPVGVVVTVPSTVYVPVGVAVIVPDTGCVPEGMLLTIMPDSVPVGETVEIFATCKLSASTN